MTNMAIDYGKQFINQNIPANYGGMLEKYIPIGQLKVMQRCSLFVIEIVNINYSLVLLCCGQHLRHQEAGTVAVPLCPL